MSRIIILHKCQTYGLYPELGRQKNMGGALA